MNSRERKSSRKLALKIEGEKNQKGFIDLDTQRDLPIKRAMSAYVLFGNELRKKIQNNGFKNINHLVKNNAEFIDRIYAHIGNTGPYSSMKDINSALYSRNFKEIRAYESHEIQALTDSVNEGFLKNAEARNTMLPKIGKVANELDIYDSIFRKINFQRLDDMYNEHAEIMKVMPELKDLYKNIKVTKPKIVDKIKNSHLYEIDKLREAAMDLKVYNSIIETEGSIYKKGSEYRETAKYDVEKTKEPAYREQKLKEVVRAVEEYLTNDVTVVVLPSGFT